MGEQVGRSRTGSVALYCWQHNEVHRFTVGEVERIVYALTASVADERVEPCGLFVGEASHDNLDCPQAVLKDSHDPEVYEEHAEQGVECRRAASADASTTHQSWCAPWSSCTCSVSDDIQPDSADAKPADASGQTP